MVSLTAPALRCMLRAQAFSNILYALARLGVRPQRQWSIAFFRHSLPMLPTFSLQSLSNITWALARLRCEAPPPAPSAPSR